MERVINYISVHGSKDSPISNREMASSLNLSEVTIRNKINKARYMGYPICSCDKGYYLSNDKAEILNTIQSLMHRTIAVENAINGLLSVVKCELEECRDE